MSAAPPTGAWKRSGLIVDGIRVPDLCDVLWLQTLDTFADIRLPLAAGADPLGASSGRGALGSPAARGAAGLFDRARAFAGVAHWNEPAMVWEHTLDVDPEPVTDVGTLDVSTPGWAYEDGTAVWDGKEIPFREEWELISAPGDPVATAVTPDQISVTVGRWRIDVVEGRPDGVFLAERRESAGGVWKTVGAVTAP